MLSVGEARTSYSRGEKRLEAKGKQSARMEEAQEV